MSRLSPTNRNNPCPVCQDIKGKCRTTDGDLILCMNAHEDIPGWRFIGDSSNGLWGKLLPTGADRGEWHPAPKPERQPDRIAVTPQQHDREWRSWLAQTQLQEHHLSDRGLSAREIGILRPFTRSVADGSVMTFPSFEGLLVGGQKRLDNPGDSGRYRWYAVRTDWDKHIDGELPLACWLPGRTIGGNPSTDIPHLIEGTTFKPAIAAVRFGLPVVGAAGGLHHSSPQTLAHTLQVLGSTRIVVVPDAGDAVNPQVIRLLRAKVSWLEANGYQVSIAWWGQFTKDACDIDELESLDGLRHLTPDQFWAIVAQHSPGLLGKLARTGKDLATRAKDILLAKIEGRRAIQRPDGEVIEFAPGRRNETIARLISQGYKNILEKSGPGTGKSYGLGQLIPDQVGADRLWYQSEDHRNPTTPTLAEWPDLEARHGGLVREARPNGETRLVRADGSQPYAVPPNCHRNRMASALRDRYVTGADKAGIVCRACPLREACLHSEGTGYGYLHQRVNAFKRERIRMHPDSLPGPDFTGWNTTGLLWDEGQLRATETRDVTAADVKDAIAHLATKHPELWPQAQPLLTALLALMEGKQGKFGVEHGTIAAAVGDTTGIDLDALQAALAPNLAALNPTEDHGVDIGDLPPSLRKKFAPKDATGAGLVEGSVLKQWLPEFIQVLRGEINGGCHIRFDTLTLTLPFERHRDAAKRAKFNVFADATLTREDLALKLGIDPSEIVVIRQREPQTRLTIKQIPDLGRMGMQRGPDQSRRLEALTPAIGGKVIDFKKFAGEGDGAWWRDSRGSNDFINERILTLIGTPCPNLASLQGEWRTLTGTEPTGDDFKEWVNRKIEADIVQGIGRLRANLRPDEPLTVYLITDFPLTTIDTEKVRATDITPAAGTKTQRAIHTIAQAMQQAAKTGAKVTREAVQALTGIALGTINRYWSEAKKSDHFAIGDSNSKMINFSPTHPHPPDTPLIWQGGRWMVERIDGAIAVIFSLDALEKQEMRFERVPIAQLIPA